MHHDERPGNHWIIGYDLRVSPSSVGPATSKLQVSFDPGVWTSARDLNARLFCDTFGVSDVKDTANGLNLATSPPVHTAPSGYVVAAFDAPEEIIVMMSESFGLQNAIGAASQALSTEGFLRLGYDVADLWTQRTALYATDVFQSVLEAEKLALNDWGLFSDLSLAAQACSLAETRDAKSYFPVGVWARV